MAAAQEAGKTSPDELMDFDSVEFEAWSRYAMSGPSQLRTQMLIAQLIQMVAGALGGKSIPMEKLLPYHAEITGSNSLRARQEKRARTQAYHQGLVDDIVAKAKKDG